VVLLYIVRLVNVVEYIAPCKCKTCRISTNLNKHRVSFFIIYTVTLSLLDIVLKVWLTF